MVRRIAKNESSSWQFSLPNLRNRESNLESSIMQPAYSRSMHYSGLCPMD